MVVLFVLSLGILMLGFERWRPGRAWPSVRHWYVRAVLANVVQVASVFIAGSAWDGWLLRHRLWSTDHLPSWLAGVIGYFVLTFVYYWWHRARHASNWLWRVFHQVHHSPQRIEVLTAFYKHPLEILADSFITSVTLYVVVGTDPAAAMIGVLLSGVAELLYHWNVRTPHWVGYIIQRPESHCVHHEAGHHSQNYGDLPIWDIAFGTFHNPKYWNKTCGLGENEHALGEMLAFRDVGNPR